MLTITEHYEKFLMWVDSCLGKLEDYSIIIYEKKDTETLIIYDLQLTMLIIFFFVDSLQ